MSGMYSLNHTFCIPQNPNPALNFYRKEICKNNNNNNNNNKNMKRLRTSTSIKCGYAEIIIWDANQYPCLVDHILRCFVSSVIYTCRYDYKFVGQCCLKSPCMPFLIVSNIEKSWRFSQLLTNFSLFDYII